MNEKKRASAGPGDGSKPTRTTNIGQSHSFNYHHNRQSKKSAVGMGLANINQQLLSATMFGVVLGGDSKASQQVVRSMIHRNVTHSNLRINCPCPITLLDCNGLIKNRKVLLNVIEISIIEN